MDEINKAYNELNTKVRQLDRKVKAVGDNMMALEIAIDEIRHQVKILGDAIRLESEGTDGSEQR